MEINTSTAHKFIPSEKKNHNSGYFLKQRKNDKVDTTKSKI